MLQEQVLITMTSFVISLITFQSAMTFDQEWPDVSREIRLRLRDYLSLCSIYAPNTKLHACVVFSGDTETR